MASGILSSVHKLSKMTKCRDQILQPNFSQVQVNGPGPPALGEKGGGLQSTMEESKWEQGSLHFYRRFWRCSSACLSVFWSLEASSAPPQSLLLNTGSTFLRFRWRQENQKFKLNFGCLFLKKYITIPGSHPSVQGRETKSKQQMECVGYLQIVAEQI